MATLEAAEARFGKKPDVTPLLKLPLLTDEEKERLVNDSDRGIIPVTGLRRYPTFEDWQESGGLVGKNNFWMHFKSESFMIGFPEMRWMQRYVYLYADKYEDLEKMTDEWHGRYTEGDKGALDFTAEQERLYWEAYENIASLVSADDPYLDNGHDLPQGEAYPTILFG